MTDTDTDQLEPVEQLPSHDAGGYTWIRSKAMRWVFLLVGSLIGGYVILLAVFQQTTSSGQQKSEAESRKLQGEVVLGEMADFEVDDPIIEEKVPEEAVLPPEALIPEIVAPPAELDLSQGLPRGPDALDAGLAPSGRDPTQKAPSLLPNLDQEGMSPAQQAQWELMEERKARLIDAFQAPTSIGFETLPVSSAKNRQGTVIEAGVGAQLRLGTIVSAVLSHAVMSDTPAPMQAVVSYDIHHSAGTGEVIIPRGAILLGFNTGIQRNRILGTWNLVRFPDGREYPLQALLAHTDGSGGVPGKLFSGAWRRNLAAIGSLGFATAAAIASNSSEQEYQRVIRNVINEDGSTSTEEQLVPVPLKPEDVAYLGLGEGLSELVIQNIDKQATSLPPLRVEVRHGTEATAILLQPFRTETPAR